MTGLILRGSGATTDIYASVGSVISGNSVLTNGINGADGIYKATIPAGGCPTNWSLISTPANGWPAGSGSGIPGSQGGNPLGRIDIAMAPSNHDYIYAQVHNPAASSQGQLGVWRTTDGGVTWSQRSTAAALRDCSGSAGDTAQNWYNQGIAVDPSDPETFFMETYSIYKSTDGGTSFVDAACSGTGGIVHPDQHALEFMPGTPNTLLGGNDGGVYLTQNARNPVGNWVSLNDTLNTIEFYGGDITSNFANAFSPGAMGGAQDNGTSAAQWFAPATPGPASWQWTLGGDGGFSRIEPMQENNWYQEYQFGRLYVSSGGPFGGTQYIEGGWFGPNDHPSFIFPYEIYKNDCPPTGCTHLIGGSQRVWETILGGIPRTTWYTNSLDLTKNLGRRSAISQLNYSVALSTTAIVGTTDGNVQYGFGLGQGTRGSATWVNVTGDNTLLPNRAVLDVATDPINPLIGYAALGGFDQNTPSSPGHMFRVTCTANCASFTWANKTGNLPDIPIDSVIANPRFPQQVFAGTNWGLYYTDDISVGSPVWYRFNAGLPSAMIYDMSIDRGFTTLSVWTRSRGAYAWPLPAGPLQPTPTVTGTPPTITSTPTGGPQTATPTIPAATPTTAPSSTMLVTATITTTPTGAATLTPTACPITFSDVQPTDYFYVAVRYLFCSGVISGYSDGTFRPGSNTTRGQLSKIVVLAMGWELQCPAAPHFSDVHVGSVFYCFVETAFSHSIISGYNDGTFRPGNNVTRGQLCKIVVIALGWTIVCPAAGHFSDVPAGSAFYCFVETAFSHGIISGYDDGTFRPGNSATRGQICKIVYQAVIQR